MMSTDEIIRAIKRERGQQQQQQEEETRSPSSVMDFFEEKKGDNDDGMRGTRRRTFRSFRVLPFQTREVEDDGDRSSSHLFYDDDEINEPPSIVRMKDLSNFHHHLTIYDPTATPTPIKADDKEGTFTTRTEQHFLEYDYQKDTIKSVASRIGDLQLSLEKRGFMGLSTVLWIGGRQAQEGWKPLACVETVSRSNNSNNNNNNNDNQLVMGLRDEMKVVVPNSLNAFLLTISQYLHPPNPHNNPYAFPKPKLIIEPAPPFSKHGAMIEFEVTLKHARALLSGKGREVSVVERRRDDDYEQRSVTPPTSSSPAAAPAAELNPKLLSREKKKKELKTKEFKDDRDQLAVRFFADHLSMLGLSENDKKRSLYDKIIEFGGYETGGKNDDWMSDITNEEDKAVDREVDNCRGEVDWLMEAEDMSGQEKRLKEAMKRCSGSRFQKYYWV
jgi:hypothetical protein